MATAIKDSLTDHSPLDGTNDAINGAEVDANANVISQILDGTTATDLATDSTVAFRFTGSRAGIRLINTDNATGAIHYGLDMEWNPGDGGQMTDGSSGVGMRFLMPDAADTQTAYARMYVLMRDDTAASDDAEFVFEAAVGGTLTTELLHMSGGGTGGVNGTVFNDDSGDIDFRIEGANTTNGFLLDAGQDAISLGGANVDGAAFTLNNLQSRTAITSVGSQFHIPAQTTNFDNSSGTIAIGAAAFIGIPTWTNASSALTMTHSASLYIQGIPVADSNVTATNAPYALWIDAGETRLDGATTFNGTITVGVNDTGHDVKFFGDADSAYMLWDTSADDLILAGAAGINVAGTATLATVDINAGAIDGTTIGAASAAAGTFAAIVGTTIDASTDFTIGDTVITNGVITDSTGLALAANVTVTGNVLPNADDTYDLGSASAAWQDIFLEGDITLSDAGTIATSAGALTLTSAAAATWSTSAGALTIDGDDGIVLNTGGSGDVQVNENLVVGVNDTGYDVKFFGATSGAYMLWDESADALLVSGSIDMVDNNNRIDLDADNDTSIRASADDVITFEVGCNDLYKMDATSIDVGTKAFTHTHHVSQVVTKTGLADNSATAVFTITTTNESGDADGGGYACHVRALIGHKLNATASAFQASRSFQAHFSRAMAGDANISSQASAVTEISETATAATYIGNPGERNIAGVTMTTSESTEYVQNVLFQVDLTGDVDTGEVVVLVDLIYYGFNTPPVIAVA